VVDRQDWARDKDRKFATLTYSLLDASTVGDVLEQVVYAAANIVPGTDVVSITLRDIGGRVFTPVQTDAVAAVAVRRRRGAVGGRRSRSRPGHGDQWRPGAQSRLTSVRPGRGAARYPRGALHRSAARCRRAPQSGALNIYSTG
jgi:hypothetical protein